MYTSIFHYLQKIKLELVVQKVPRAYAISKNKRKYLKVNCLSYF